MTTHATFPSQFSPLENVSSDFKQRLGLRRGTFKLIDELTRVDTDSFFFFLLFFALCFCEWCIIIYMNIMNWLRFRSHDPSYRVYMGELFLRGLEMGMVMDMVEMPQAALFLVHESWQITKSMRGPIFSWLFRLD